MEPITRAPSAPPRYTLLEEIGRGAFSVVYRARDEALGREVAFKLLGRVDSGANEERLLREARCLGALDDPGVVTVMDVGHTPEGTVWLVMGLVRGPTLDDVIGDEARLPVAESLRIVAAIAHTLERVHAAGLRHRDVKPSNILLTPDGEPLLSDFGIALDVREVARLTRAGNRPGTPAYMAPELFEAALGEPDWARADVFALGLVLAECLLGARAGGGFGDSNPGRQLWIEGLENCAPRGLVAICRKATDPDPGRRYPTAAALATELDRYAAQQPVKARLASVLRRSWLAVRRDRVLLLLAVLTMAVLIVGGAGVREGLRSRHVRDARAAHEAAAEERLTALQERRARLAMDGREEEAEDTFQAFVALPENQGTPALATAWLQRGRDLFEGDPPESAAGFIRAFYGQLGPVEKAAAARGAIDALRRHGNCGGLHILLAELDRDPETAAIPDLEQRLDLALHELQIADALTLLTSTDARRPFLEHIRFGRVGAAPAPATSPQCGMDGLLVGAEVSGTYFAGTGGYERRLIRVDPTTCKRLPVDHGTDALDSWTQAIARADIDGDGTDELVLGMGPPLAYGLRVLDLRGDTATARVSLHRLGDVRMVGAIRYDDARDAIVAVTQPGHPSDDVFPSGTPAPAVVVLAWEGAALREVVRVPVPSVNGSPVHPSALVVADLDGDGDEDVIVGGMALSEEARAPIGESLVLLREGDTYLPLPLGHFYVREAVTEGGRIGLNGEDGAGFWTLGLGDREHTALADPRARIGEVGADTARLDDDTDLNLALALDALGLHEAVDDELVRLGRTRSGLRAADAWARVAETREARADLTAAAEAWREAARMGDAGGWARAAEAYGQVARSDDVAAALSEGAKANPALAAELLNLGIKGVRPVALTAPLQDFWAIRSPFVRMQDGLVLESTAGMGLLARLSLRRTEGLLALNLSATVERQEWAHRIAVRLGPAGAPEPLVLGIQVSGGGGRFTRDVTIGPTPQVVVSDSFPGAAHRLRIGLTESPGGGRFHLDVEWDGQHAGAVDCPLPRWPDVADWTLEILAEDRGVEGMFGRVRVDALAVGGLQPAGSAEPIATGGKQDARASTLAMLRIDPVQAGANLVRDQGIDRALPLVEAAFGSAAPLAARNAGDLGRLLGGLSILDDPRASKAFPELVAWRGVALLEAGNIEKAAALLTRANAAAGKDGFDCFAARSGLMMLARMLGADASLQRAAAAECAGAPEVAEVWTRRLQVAAQ